MTAQVSADVFRHAMTCFASGITAITTQEAGVPFGLIATSVCSLSADPATILVCVNKTASAHDVILRTQRFAVNLLSAQHLSVAKRFTSLRGAERFDAEHWQGGKLNIPTLVDAVVVFECRLAKVHDGFTHSIIVGQITEASVNDEGASDCLLWHHRDFARSTQQAA
ncbi:flavin reductase family protein [Pandoraea norimbergensis]|uniref:Flavin oxidoreductase n=1 Tax=Pandoraea norimbergensis TaxID=93219 RepID=A0ABN4JNG1_9BURK|nr:flavin reductase family protein [Pandoraea norimbergensis]ALS61712.1 flavin oxidoreductase [Pandoraea norimbergensis]